MNSTSPNAVLPLSLKSVSNVKILRFGIQKLVLIYQSISVHLISLGQADPRDSISNYLPLYQIRFVHVDIFMYVLSHPLDLPGHGALIKPPLNRDQA